MLELDRTAVTRLTLTFAGVVFELAVDPRVPWLVSPGYSRHIVDDEDGVVSARLRCEVVLDASLPTRGIAGISVRHGALGTHVECNELRAELTQTQPGQFHARARVSPGPHAADAVLLSLSAAVVERQGGVHLHAAAVALDGHAVLFIGPSGAGKSTAVELCADGSVLSNDRVSVVEHGGHHYAWSLPGGKATHGPWATRRALPIAAILRVRRGEQRPRLEPLSGARSCFVLRESIDCADLSVVGEERRMNVVQKIAQTLPVAEIRTVLGQSHDSLLRELIAARFRSQSLASSSYAHA